MGAVSWDGMFGSYFDREASWWRSYFLDRCGEVRWTLPDDATGWTANLVGFDGKILVRHGADKMYWYSSEGAPLLGPKPARGLPMLLGADGVAYAKQCSGSTDSADYLLTAYDANLDELWSINAGPPCGWGPIALGQDGVVYSAASSSNGMEIVAIQTTSPGLAPTAWPALFHDNKRTNWLR